jgi:hypothetical protein
LESLTWELATRLGKAPSTSDAAADSNTATAGSSGGGSGGYSSSSRASIAEAALAASQCRHQQTLLKEDILQPRNHLWPLDVLLLLVDSHLAAQALAAGAAEPGAAAAAAAAAVECAATGSSVQQPRPSQQQQQQLAARVSSTIQHMLRILGVSDLALEELAAVRQQQLNAGALDSWGQSIPAAWTTPSHPAAVQLCAFGSAVAGLKADLEALNDLLRQEGAEYMRIEDPADISRGVQCLREELRVTLPLLLLQVIAAFDAGAALQLPAAVVADTAGAVGSFCRLFVASDLRARPL